MLIFLFLVSRFNFLFVPCGGLSWLPVSFLLHVKYTLSYRIVLTLVCCFLRYSDEDTRESTVQTVVGQAR